MTQREIKKKVKTSIEQESPLVLTTNNFLRTIEDQLFLFLKHYIVELSLDECEDMIVYAIRELAANANKANLKRLYFLEKNLDINNSDHYRLGMASFKDEAFTDLSHYTVMLEEQNIYVKFSFQARGENFTITIINNTVLSREEEERINEKIHHAWKFKSMAEAMMELLDGTEGAGLGIVSIIMMLKNMGVSERDSLSVKKTPTETHSIIKIPYRKPGFGKPNPSIIEEL